MSHSSLSAATRNSLARDTPAFRRPCRPARSGFWHQVADAVSRSTPAYADGPIEPSSPPRPATTALTYADAARVLGATRAEVRRLVQSRQLPTVTLDGAPRIPASALRHYAQGHPRAS
ncbi:helix-turn-helix domain-containing protein [Streptomyces sp. TRM 70351]|uniref:helix-turn-helix domain-containing protein n=1 Tax=Streptomyces sp. TRM 70351 TaxID=3116552 RepID=UPI002E7C39A5|nr:helix-turn-helix domain-containing protein [Streptomyces sp. TRM 70351]MEE1930181.1 helix-turn-helix domain-containing protein [Streptomyces sp. TRM 70351]